MAIGPGDRIGPYEVTALLGEGGMGKVWRAHHAALKRDAALKVLPDIYASDPERLARFQREAQILASINHPNIAHVYGLEQADGVQALVIELVEGPTLADRIAQGPIPIDEVMAIAKQIAEALEAAHEQGIVHRDLKPANVKLRSDGTVKVLDFGLAKAMEPAFAMAAGLSESPTVTTPAMTQAGRILGTPAYMSPEQAEGKPVDKRTDIWAFGVVVYEMVTGQAPFIGESFASTAAAVLRTEPDWARVPPGLRPMLVACLEKDRRRRLRDVGDAWRLIEQPTPAVAARRQLWPLAAMVVLAVGAAIVWMMSRPTPSAPALVMRWSITLVESGGGERGVALSRDGRLLAYTGRVLPRRPIWVRALNEAEGRPLPGTDGGRRPFFSPDGKWLAYFSSFGASSLMKVPLAGGAPTKLCDNAVFQGGSWGDDDHIVFTGSKGLMRVSASGGACEALTTASGEMRAPGQAAHRWPQILPGGKTVLFGIASTGDAEDSEDSRIGVLNLASREQRVLEQRGNRARHLASGHLVYMRSGTMFAVPFDLGRLQTTGPEVLAIAGVLGAGYTVSDSGTLVYTAAETPHRTLSWIERKDGTTVASPAPPREYGSVSVSPDGRRVATFLTVGGPGALPGVLIVDLERGTTSQIAGRGNFPIWTHDGTRIVFSRGPGEVLWAPADGSGTPQLLASERFLDAASISPDGTVLASTVRSSTDVNARAFIKLLTFPGGTPAEAGASFSSTNTYNERDGRISPDGKWIAYVSDESGKNQVYLRSFKGPGGKVPISIDGGDEPRWSRNPQELFFRNTTTNQVMTADLPATIDSRPGRPRAVVALGTSLWDVAPDGKRFLVVKDPDTDADPATVRVVVNWFEELRQKTSAR